MVTSCLHVTARTITFCPSQDVAWHCYHADILGSVSDDKQLTMCGALMFNHAAPLMP